MFRNFGTVDLTASHLHLECVKHIIMKERSIFVVINILARVISVVFDP